jgi:hypothetical protein
MVCEAMDEDGQRGIGDGGRRRPVDHRRSMGVEWSGRISGRR